MAKKGNKYKGYEPGEGYDPTGISKYLGVHHFPVCGVDAVENLRWHGLR